MAWVLVLVLQTGFATLEVKSPAHCWTALGHAISHARLYQRAFPSQGFAIKAASCKRIGGIRT